MASNNPSTSLATQEVDLRATFKVHKSSLKTFLEVNDVQDEKKKKIIFLLSLRKELEELLQGLCTQDELEEMSCAELLTRLERVLRSDDLLLQYTSADKHQEPTPSGSRDDCAAPVQDQRRTGRKLHQNQTVTKSTVGVMVQNSKVNLKNVVITTQERGQTARNPMPYKLRNNLSTFRGRKDYLDDLTVTLDKSDCNVVVVHGFSGVGKSELCNQYAWRNIQRYQKNIVWIHAEHLEQELLNLARELDVNTKCTEWMQPSDRPITQITKDVYSLLREKGVCLLILDDVLTRDMINQFLPGDQHKDIRVLITSPYAYWRGVHTIKLLPLTDSESKDILAAALENQLDLETQKDDLENLLTIVSGYPLAVQICASYISYVCQDETNFVLSKYVDKLETKLFNIEDHSVFKSSESTYDKTIYISLETTLEKIEKIIHKNSKLLNSLTQVLNVCAYLNAEAIGRSLLNTICKTEDLDETIRILVNFSLVQNDDGRVRMHKLIQKAIILHQQKLHKESKWYQKVLEYFIENSERPDPHTECVFSHAQHHNKLIYEIYSKKFCRSKLLINLVRHNCLSVLMHIFEQVKSKRKLKKLVKDNDLMLVAMRLNQWRVAEHLVMYADLDKRYEDETLLHLAARHGQAGLCQLLLNRKCSDEVKTKGGHYAIHVAAEHGHQEVVELLVKKNPASVTWIDLDNHIPLHLAARRGHVHVLRCLLEVGGAAVDTPGGKDCRTALMEAARGGHTEAVGYLLEHGASIQARDTIQWSALHHASVGGQADTVALLVAAPGCNVYVTDKIGRSPFHLAAHRGHVHVLRCLLEVGGVAVDTPGGRDRSTALMEAAQGGHIEAVRYLLEMPGCGVNALDGRGKTPLHGAAWGGHLDVVRVLCAAGARGDVLDHHGDIPLALAFQRGHTEVCAFIEEQFSRVKERRA